MKIVIAIAIILSLSGCATIHDTFWEHGQPEPVMVPVIVNPPKPPVDAFEQPELPIDSIGEADTPDIVAKKYVTSIITLEAFIRKLQAYLNVYNGIQTPEE